MMEYVIFSIDKWYDLHTLAKFTRHLDTLRSMGKLEGEVKLIIGSYEDKPELSFICMQSDFNNFVKDSGYVDNQDSFLYVGDEKGMPARLIDKEGKMLDGGRLKEVGPLMAFEESSWSYRPDLNKFYVCL
jgi:hypothetical protein